MKFIGYHRTSTDDRTLDKGINAIRDFCRKNNCPLHNETVYADENVGKGFSCPTYQKLKAHLIRPGDVLIITDVYILGRGKYNISQELHYFQEQNIRLMILKFPSTCADYRSMDGKTANMLTDSLNSLLVEIYSSFAENEIARKTIRQKEGIQAKKNSKTWDGYGRPRKMSMEEFRDEYDDCLKRNLSPLEIMDELGLKKSTFYNYVGEYEKWLNTYQPKIRQTAPFPRQIRMQNTSLP